jgi:hypothetical protein
MQIFADGIEFCWIHLRGIGALENSLWGYDGKGIRVWLNALAIETPPADDPTHPSESVKESVNIPLDFYPLCEFGNATCTTCIDLLPYLSCPYGQRNHHWSRT